MKENFLNLVKEIDMQVQETQRVSNKMEAKRPTPRHIIKMSKVKEKEMGGDKGRMGEEMRGLRTTNSYRIAMGI